MTRAALAQVAVTVVASMLLACGAEVRSEYPIAIDAAKVGQYPALTKSGGGYVYDEVLEYRVWVHSTSGGDTFRAFATFEEAEQYAKSTAHAEAPLVLVLQHEHVNEPEPGTFVHVKGDRIAEWQVQWLAGSKRTPAAIAELLARNRK